MACRSESPLSLPISSGEHAFLKSPALGWGILRRAWPLPLAFQPAEESPGQHACGPYRQPCGQQHTPGGLGEGVEQDAVQQLAQGLGAQGQGEHKGHDLSIRRSGVRAWMAEMAQVEKTLHPAWQMQKNTSSTPYRPRAPKGSRKASPQGSRHRPNPENTPASRPRRRRSPRSPTQTPPKTAATPKALSAMP